MRRFITAPQAPQGNRGKSMILYGALAMMVMSAYLLYSQFVTNEAWLRALSRLSKAHGTNMFSDFMVMLQEPALRQVFARMLFLLAMIIVSYVVIRMRRSPRGCLWIILLCAGCAALGFALGLYSFSGWFNLLSWLELLPFAVIIAGCVIRIAEAAILLSAQTRGVQIHRTRQPGTALKSDGRIYRDAPGVVRQSLPDARLSEQTQRHRRVKQPQTPARLEKPVPVRSDYHVGPVPEQPPQKPRHEWKTIKK